MKRLNHFERLAEVFEHARTLTGEARGVYLDQACDDNPELRQQVQVLLDQHDIGGILDEPIKIAEAVRESVPEQVGQYRIVEVLGRGGMGIVYRAEQDQPQRAVAVKIMRAEIMSVELRRRFEFESSVLARLQHPGIAQIYEVGTWDDGSGSRPYFAMELSDGVTLDKFIESRQPAIEQRLRLFIAICDAVHHAHQKGVIHRDLKPGNIMVTADGSPKILDFGVARATDVDMQATRHTTVGQLIGTLAYMSPEQVNASVDSLDTRSDVYALGVILYELLTDRLPYDLGGSTVAGAARAIEESEPASLTLTSRHLRGDLDTITLKALRKAPKDRYQSASDLAADIRRFLVHQPISARPATVVYQLSRFTRRHRGLVAGLVGIVLVVILGSGAVAWQASRVNAEARTRREVAAFLREMLTSIDPAKTGGEPLTVRDMLDDAAARLGERFAMAPQVRGELHDTVGFTYYNLGDYEAAERHLHAAFDDRMLALGPTANETLMTMATLGVTLRQLGRLDEAEAILVSARAKLRSPESSAAHHIRGNLAIVLDEMNRDDEAEALYREEYERSLTQFGWNDPSTLFAQNNLGKMLMDRGQFDEARSLLEPCLSHRREVLGDDHPYTIVTMANVGALYGNMGRTNACVTLLLEAAERSERVLGPAHLSTIRRRQALVQSSLIAGDFLEAAKQAQVLLDACNMEWSASHPETLAALELTVTAIALGGDMAQAEALSLNWHGRVQLESGPTHRSTGRVAYLLLNLYDEWGRADEVAAWRARVEETSFQP